MKSDSAGQCLDASCVEELKQRVAATEIDLRRKFDETRNLPYGREVFSGFIVQALSVATSWGWTAGYDPCKEILRFGQELENPLAA